MTTPRSLTAAGAVLCLLLWTLPAWGVTGTLSANVKGSGEAAVEGVTIQLVPDDPKLTDEQRRAQTIERKTDSAGTATITARMMSAPVSPSETSATSTASAPTTMAPTMGTNPPKKVRIASGMASGTPTITRAMPISTASIALTIAWVRM